MKFLSTEGTRALRRFFPQDPGLDRTGQAMDSRQAFREQSLFYKTEMGALDRGCTYRNSIRADLLYWRKRSDDRMASFGPDRAYHLRLHLFHTGVARRHRLDVGADVDHCRGCGAPFLQRPRARPRGRNSSGTRIHSSTFCLGRFSSTGPSLPGTRRAEVWTGGFPLTPPSGPNRRFLSRGFDGHRDCSVFAPISSPRSISPSRFADTWVLSPSRRTSRRRECGPG